LKKSIKTLLFVLMVLFLASLFIIHKQHTKISFLKGNLPYLLPGEKIDYFDVLNTKDERLGLSNIDNNATLLFIFERPCTRCNKNIKVWQKIAQIVKRKNNVNVYGIVLGDPKDMFNLAGMMKLNFDLCSAVDQTKLIDSLRIRLNLPQTVLLKNGKVSSVLIGELTGDNYTKILKKVMMPTKNNKKEV